MQWDHRLLRRSPTADWCVEDRGLWIPRRRVILLCNVYLEREKEPNFLFLENHSHNEFTENDIMSSL